MKVATNDRFSPRRCNAVQPWPCMRKLVVQLVLVLAVASCGGGGSSSSLLPGRSPNGAGTGVGDQDAGDIEPDGAPASSDFGSSGAEPAPAPPADAAPSPPAPDAAPTVQYPACSDTVTWTACPLPSRTPDQRFSCAVCSTTSGPAAAQRCIGFVPPDDLPWLCVASCAECWQVDCRARPMRSSPCTFSDAGAP
jgi:hypothetical protein